MGFQQGRIDAYMDTIRAIAESARVEEYVIGYTASQLSVRKASYVNVGFDHAVARRAPTRRREIR